MDGRGEVALSAFVLFRDSPLRRAALAEESGSPARYALFGAAELGARGIDVRHSLEPAFAVRRGHRAADRALRRSVRAIGGYDGDFASVLASRRAANGSDVVLSTVDTVGIPAVLLAQAHAVRPPIVYTSIGLLHRLGQLRTRAARRLYERALRGTASILAYGHAEAEAIRAWLPGHDVRFVPFGVDTEAFAPREAEPEVDVLSVGRDPERDYPLLLRVAAALPHVSFAVIASAEQARTLRPPPNVRIESEVSIDEVRRRLATARVVALPVQENLYSGATTTLLQAMASGRPVVVSRTAAVAGGYGLADGDNVRLVAPGDDAAFGVALQELLGDEAAAARLGAAARATVERDLGWERYVDHVESALRDASARR